MGNMTTRISLQQTALRLFLERGYDAVTVTDVARAAGVSHMTFFRYFPTKESVVVGDIFDPAIAAAVAAQPASQPPLQRAIEGIITAMATPEATLELSSRAFADRIRLISTTPSLQGPVRTASAETEAALVDALTRTGSPAPEAIAAAGAVMGAATSILLSWACTDPVPTGSATPSDVIATGLRSLIEVAS